MTQSAAKPDGPRLIQLLNDMPEVDLRLEDPGSSQKRGHAVAERMLAERDHRGQLFMDEFVGEPGWEMLLRLYLSDDYDEPTTLPVLAATASCPYPTAIRYISALRERGWLEVHEMVGERWTSIAKLTPRALERLEMYLASPTGPSRDNTSQV